MIFKQTFDGTNTPFWKFSSVSIFIRGLSILSRIFLIFYLAKFLTIEKYGIYGILNSSLMIGIYLIGLDIYVYVIREIPKSTFKFKQKLVVHQSFLYLCSYVFILPIFLFFLKNRFLSQDLVLLFAFLLILEQITQEFVRIFFALRYVILANIIIFFRRVFWIILFIIVSYLDRNFLNIKNLLLFWVVNHLFILFISYWFFKKVNIFPIGDFSINKSLLKKMIKTSMIFLGASLSLQLITYSNLYFIKGYYSSSEVGVFSFFANVLIFINVFIQVTLISIFLPKIIELKHDYDNQYILFFKKMKNGILVSVFLIGFLLLFFIKPFLVLIGKVDFIKNLNVYYILLLGFIIYGLSNIWHYFLYINHLEKFIFYSSVISCGINLLLNYLLIPNYGILGAAVSFLVAMFFLIFLKIFWSHFNLKKGVV
jgi:O-antigen/teichoic acid export membrane protein